MLLYLCMSHPSVLYIIGVSFVAAVTGALGSLALLRLAQGASDYAQKKLNLPSSWWIGLRKHAARIPPFLLVRVHPRATGGVFLFLQEQVLVLCLTRHWVKVFLVRGLLEKGLPHGPRPTATSQEADSNLVWCHRHTHAHILHRTDIGKVVGLCHHRYVLSAGSGRRAHSTRGVYAASFFCQVCVFGFAMQAH